MNNGFRAFLATPTFKDPTDYSNWLNKIEKQKSQGWKDIGIYDLIMLSKLDLDYSNPMLVSSLYFWDSTHYTFYLPYGMVTLTLFDMAAITGLKPTGHTYDPDVDSIGTISFSTTRATYSTYITHYHDKDIEIVSDVEHIAFLALWLSHSVFCSKSLQVAKKYLALANQLHVGHDICLSEMILASLYESLSDRVAQLKNLGDKGNLLLSGPFWLLQLWLNATFEANLPTKGLVDEDTEEIRRRRVEGPRLAQLTPRDEGQVLLSTFMSYIMMFAKSHNFTSSMAPFALRKVFPRWFTRTFPSLSKKQETKSFLIWEAFLTPQILTLRFNPSKVQVTLITYQPNLVTRQFGLIQVFLKCLDDKKSSLLLHNSVHTEAITFKQISKYTGRTQLTPFHFELSFLYSREFRKWWAKYYIEEFCDVTSFIQLYDKAFLLVRERTKKGTYTLIKKFKFFKPTLKLPIDLMILVERTAKQLLCSKRSFQRN